MSRRGCIVITGSSGLIGAVLAQRLSAAYKVFGFDRERSPSPTPEIESTFVDLISEKSLESGLSWVRSTYGNRIKSVIHLADYCDFSGGLSSQYDVMNVRATERLLRALQGFETDQLIYVSTMLVHAPCERGRRINEDWPLSPKWDYPRSKLAGEQIIQRYAPHMRRVLLRIAGVYDDRCHCLPLGQQMKRIYERSPLSHVFPGEILNGRPYLHLNDLLEAVESAVGRGATLPNESLMLLGEEEALSYDELQREFGRLIHGEEWRTHRISKSQAKEGVWLKDRHLTEEEMFIKPWMIDLADDHYALDITRARQILNWEPKQSLRATLPLMVEALKTDPAAWSVENKLEAGETTDAEKESVLH